MRTHSPTHTHTHLTSTVYNIAPHVKLKHENNLPEFAINRPPYA